MSRLGLSCGPVVLGGWSWVLPNSTQKTLHPDSHLLLPDPGNSPYFCEIKTRCTSGSESQGPAPQASSRASSCLSGSSSKATVGVIVEEFLEGTLCPLFQWRPSCKPIH